MQLIKTRRDPESRHIDLRYHMRITGVEPELAEIIAEIALACKYIINAVQTGDLGIAGTSNIYGDQQLALDILSDRIIRRRLENSGLVRCFASEEQEEIITCFRPDNGKFSVAYDPLDGSSLVDVNLAIATIAAIHKGDNLLEPGSKLAAAMYVIYGPRTTLVYCAGKGVHEFAMNHIGEFVLINENIQMKPRATIYSPGGIRSEYLPPHDKFVRKLEERGVKLRYSGGFASDVNQIMMKGEGIFMYPALKSYPEGKLRLLFELQPLAFIVEHAGGKASTGKQPLLDVVPSRIDQRSPIYIGCREDVELAEKILSEPC